MKKDTNPIFFIKHCFMCHELMSIFLIQHLFIQSITMEIRFACWFSLRLWNGISQFSKYLFLPLAWGIEIRWSCWHYQECWNTLMYCPFTKRICEVTTRSSHCWHSLLKLIIRIFLDSWAPNREHELNKSNFIFLFLSHFLPLTSRIRVAQNYI